MVRFTNARFSNKSSFRDYALTIYGVHLFSCRVVNVSVCVCACVCRLDGDDCESMTLLRIIQ